MQSKAVAQKMWERENGSHWRALTEYRLAPSEETAKALFAAVIRVAKLVERKEAR